jgi:ABC-type uncharacterized transport system permease subunit
MPHGPVGHRDCGNLYAVLLNLSLIGYVVATGLALAYLVQREEMIYRLTAAATLGGWAFHTLGLVAETVTSGRPPISNLPDAISVAVWAAVLLEVWAERQYGIKVLGAFVLPVVVLLSLSTTIAMPAGLGAMGSTFRNAWITVHVVLALLGIAAFVLNFAGGMMYLLQESQLKARRPGAFYYRLPSLETLDRLTYRTLTLGFPFLTVGLLLGALWAGSFHPLMIFSAVAWAIYACTLAGRAVAGWRGRRAAYFAIIGFVALVVTLGVGFLIPGTHGS